MLSEKYQAWRDRKNGNRREAYRVISEITPTLSEHVGEDVVGFLHEKEFIIAFYKERYLPKGFKLVGRPNEVTSYVMITDSSDLDIKYSDPIFVLKKPLIDKLMVDLNGSVASSVVVNNRLNDFSLVEIGDSEYC